MRKSKFLVSLTSVALFATGAFGVASVANSNVVEAKTKQVVTNKKAKKVQNNVKTKKDKKTVSLKAVELSKDASVYTAQGKKLAKTTLKKGSSLEVGNTKTINGKKYYALGENLYLSADVVAPVKAANKKTAKTVVLRRSAYAYNVQGKRVGKSLKKGTSYKISGTKTIKGRKYYVVGKNKFISQADAKISEKQVAKADNNQAKVPAKPVTKPDTDKHNATNSNNAAAETSHSTATSKPNNINDSTSNTSSTNASEVSATTNNAANANTSAVNANTSTAANAAN